MAGRLETSQAPSAGDEPLADLGTVEVLPILLVDDRIENLRALEAVLEPLGYPLITAGSGGEALRLLLERDFALILLDVRMPGLDGLEIARLIKARTRTRDVPIVFLTAARSELEDIILGYGIGAVDYVLKPFDPELLRSKVAVFAELEASRRALKRSEAFLRGAFEAAPIGKTVLDAGGRILRANPAFANLVGVEADDLQGIAVVELCHPEDRSALERTIEGAAAGGAVPDRPSVDLRLTSRSGSEVWVGIVASSIETADLAQPLMLAQWVDLTVRSRAEQARAELLLEQAARAQAEAVAERLEKLQTLTAALEPASLDEVLPALALRLEELFDAQAAEVEIHDELDRPLVFRAQAGQAVKVDPDHEPPAIDGWQEAELRIERAAIGSLRIAPLPSRDFTAAERSLLREAAERVALGVRRAQLHEQEHRIAVELQRGLVPKRLPEVAGIDVTAHYDAAGLGAEVGGDWYDVFALPTGRVGIVLGDVAGRGIAAASAMGQLRSVARAFALADDGKRSPGEVLTFVNAHQLATGDEQLFTIVYAVVDPRKRMLTWANAGHPPPLLRSHPGATEYLQRGGGLMGIASATYDTWDAALTAGSILVFYTDGLIERRGESLDTGMARLASAVAGGPDEAAGLRDHMRRELLAPAGELYDDVTFVVVSLRGALRS